MTDRTGIERRGQVVWLVRILLLTSLVFAVRDHSSYSHRWWAG